MSAIDRNLQHSSRSQSSRSSVGLQGSRKLEISFCYFVNNVSTLLAFARQISADSFDKLKSFSTVQSIRNTSMETVEKYQLMSNIGRHVGGLRIRPLTGRSTRTAYKNLMCCVMYLERLYLGKYGKCCESDRQ